MSAPAVNPVMPFGKFKNTPFEELPDPYLAWLAKLDNLYPETHAAVAAEVERRASLPPSAPESPRPQRPPSATAPSPSTSPAPIRIDAGHHALAARVAGDAAQMTALDTLVKRLRQLAGAAGLAADAEVPF